MRVLFVSDYGTASGGAENVLIGLRDALRRRGHDARLFSSTARPLGLPLEADFSAFGTTGRLRAVLQSANPWAMGRLREVLKRFRPDVVHVRLFLTQLSPLILPLFRDVPTVLHVADYRPICPVSSKRLPDGSACRVPAGRVCYRGGCLPLRDWVPLTAQAGLMRRWWHVFDHVVANSDWVRDRLEQEGVHVDETVWNGVPTHPVRPPLTAPPTVSFAGRLVSTKGGDVLIRALEIVVRQIPDARLLMAGDGPERLRLRRLVSDLGLNPSVEMLGHVSRQSVEPRLASAWVHAVPSVWEEPFGIVAAEAMMRGTAVVASAMGGLTEFVDDGVTGYLVPANDPETLAEPLVRLLSDRDHAERLGRAARRTALAALDEELVVDRFLDVYSRLARRPSASILSLAM